MTAPVFIVKRFWQGVLVRTYGPFAERGSDDDSWEDKTAGGQARHTSAKYPKQLVVVEPIHPAAVRA